MTEKERDLLRDIHDDLEAGYPWAWTTEKTTIDDFKLAAEKLGSKIDNLLYGN